MYLLTLVKISLSDLFAAAFTISTNLLYLRPLELIFAVIPSVLVITCLIIN